MSVIRKTGLDMHGARDTGHPGCFGAACARCGKTTLNSKALVYWYGLRSVRSAEVAEIVLHAGCALTWAAHLTADAVDARNASRDAK